MVEVVLVGGMAVALAGVVGMGRWRRRWTSSAASLIRDAVASVDGPEAEALRAEFRESGVALPERLERSGLL
jgi:hypothetical protein